MTGKLRAGVDPCGDRWAAQVIDGDGLVVAERLYSAELVARRWAPWLLELELERRSRQMSILPGTWVRAQGSKT